MDATSVKTNVFKGGEWLIRESNAFDTYTPEDFNEEQKMVKEMCLQFLDAEVMPNVHRIDKMEEGLMPALMVKDCTSGRSSTTGISSSP